MERFLNIKKIVNLLELGFYFKCIRPHHGELDFYKKNGTFYVVLDKFREYPLKKDVEEIANIIYTSDYYVFANLKESLPDMIDIYNF